MWADQPFLVSNSTAKQPQQLHFVCLLNCHPSKCSPERIDQPMDQVRITFHDLLSMQHTISISVCFRQTGANHLRGGAGVYSGKTAVGSWMDGVGGPSGYSRGYTTDEFMTEAQLQQLQGRKMPKYGAALPPPSIALSDRTPTEFALSVTPSAPDHFKSTMAMDLECVTKVAVKQ